MRVLRTRSLLAGLLAVVSVAACGGASRGDVGPAPRRDAAELAEVEALYRMRKDSARMRYTDADVRFITGMIAHHAQALVMAGLAPTHGASPAIQTLAARIINAQKDEIATMQQWLRDRGLPAPEVHIAGLEVMLHFAGRDGHGAGHHGAHAGGQHDAHADMPGMLTPEQLRELDRARGEEFDRLFLTRMIQHHRGAVTMVLDLFATDGAAQDEEVFKLASDIQVDQATEIARMELMLAGLSADGDAP